MPADAVEEGAVRQAQRDRVAAAETLDLRKGLTEGGAVAGDIDELSLAGQIGTRVATRALVELGLVRAVDHDRVQAEAGNLDPSDPGRRFSGSLLYLCASSATPPSLGRERELRR